MEAVASEWMAMVKAVPMSADLIAVLTVKAHRHDSDSDSEVIPSATATRDSSMSASMLTWRASVRAAAGRAWVVSSVTVPTCERNLRPHSTDASSTRSRSSMEQRQMSHHRRQAEEDQIAERPTEKVDCRTATSSASVQTDRLSFAHRMILVAD